MAVAALCVGALLATAGCAAFRATTNGPPPIVSAVNSFVEYEQTFEQGAKAAWALVLTAIPADKVPAAQSLFAKATGLLDSAVLAVQDANRALLDGTQPHPDFGKLFGDVSATAIQVVQIVDQFTGGAPASGSVGAAPDVLHHQARALASWPTS